MNVRQIMVQSVFTISENATLEEAARTMLDHSIGCLPVVNEQGELVGIVTESDFVGKECALPFSPRSLYQHSQVLGQWLPKEGIERIYEAARTRQIREIMTRNVQVVTEAQSVEEVVQRLITQNLHRLPVMRGSIPVGIVTRRDLLRMLAKNP